uniref:Putative secreted protein n=1 Tax=Anopheles darlingi TaxID=43151 RepID=A0A2M4D8N7_ANODA
MKVIGVLVGGFLLLSPERCSHEAGQESVLNTIRHTQQKLNPLWRHKHFAGSNKRLRRQKRSLKRRPKVTLF